MSIYLFLYLSFCPSICVSIYLIISLFIDIISEPPKVARTCGVLYILTWKCASRHGGAHFFNIRTSKNGANMWCFVHHNGVHFFNIRTSKCGANMWCFVHFDFEMCFAPQRRALFRHLNFQKWSEHGLFYAF